MILWIREIETLIRKGHYLFTKDHVLMQSPVYTWKSALTSFEPGHEPRFAPLPFGMSSSRNDRGDDNVPPAFINPPVV